MVSGLFVPSEREEGRFWEVEPTGCICVFLREVLSDLFGAGHFSFLFGDQLAGGSETRSWLGL